MKVVGFLLISCVLRGAHGATKDFATLAAQVRRLYSSSGIFIVHDDHEFGFRKQRMLVEEIRSYSNEDSMSQAITYKSLEKVYKRQENALYAGIIPDREIFDRVINAMKYTEISANPWLLFIKGNISGFDCNRPGKDFFKLRMDTKMMAKCDGNSKLKMYYAITDNQTEVFDVAEWTSEKKLHFVNQKSIVKAKTNFKSMTLNVAKKTKAYDLTHKNLANFTWFLMREMATFGNFTVNVTMRTDQLGYVDGETRKWSGLMNAVVERKADLAMKLFTISGERMRDADFLTPVISSRGFFYAKLPDSLQVPWDAYLKAYSANSLMTIGIFIVLSSVFLSLMKVKFQKITNHSLVDSFINVWGLFNQQATKDATPATSIRIFYFTIIVSGLILNTIFSATIASFIAALEFKLPFSTYEEFKSDTSYKLALFRGTNDIFLIESNDSLLTPLKGHLKDVSDLPADPFEGFQQVCSDEKTILYTVGLFHRSLTNPPECQIGQVPAKRVEFLSFILPKNSPYTESMSYLVLRLREHGIVSKLRREHFYRYKEIPKLELNVISFQEILPILAILIAGVIVALLVYVVEVIIHRTSKRSKSIKMKVPVRPRNCLELKSQDKLTFLRDFKLT